MERSRSMTMKKRAWDSNESDEGDPSRKRPYLASVIVESIKVESQKQLCASLVPIIRTELVPLIHTELHSTLVPIIRTVVSEEVHRVVHCAFAKLGPGLSGRSSPKRIAGPDGKNLQLQFSSKLSLPIFTEEKVQGEQGATIHVVLLDRNTGQVVTSGPESSAKLNVMVLQGDFNNGNDDNWSHEEFESHVVKERKGKRPLLIGDLQVTLKGGRGTLGDLIFTDNSSWVRLKMFRLGIEFASGFFERIRILEATTDAFPVKEQRGKTYEKHHPPALNDEVWRLENIGKDGRFHQRLHLAGIQTVEDFLRLVNRDSQELRSILGGSMTNNKWEILTKHARTCALSGQLYIFYADDTKIDAVVFNNIYELRGHILGGQYYPADSLSGNHKVYVDSLVKKAYDNWNHIVEYDGTTLLSFEQNKQPVASLSEVPLRQREFSSSFDQQGYNNDDWTSYLMDSPQVYIDALIQSNGSFVPQNQLISDSHEAQTRNDIGVGLALCPLQASISEFQTVGPAIEPSNLTLYTYQYLSEENIDEMLESDDMQHPHPTFSIDNHNSVNETDDHLLYSPCVSFPSTIHSWELEDQNPVQVTNRNQDEENHNVFHFPTTNYSFNKEDHYRSSGKAVIGWVKMKAAIRRGIFMRRAQLVELDD